MKKPTKPRKRSTEKSKKKIIKKLDEADEATDFQRDFGGLPERDLKKGLGCGG